MEVIRKDHELLYSSMKSKLGQALTPFRLSLSLMTHTLTTRDRTPRHSYRRSETKKMFTTRTSQSRENLTKTRWLLRNPILCRYSPSPNSNLLPLHVPGCPSRIPMVSHSSQPPHLIRPSASIPSRTSHCTLHSKADIHALYDR